MNKDQNLKNILEKINPKTKQDKNVANSAQIEKKEQDRAKILANDALESELNLKIMICRWVKKIVTFYLLFIALILSAITFKLGTLENSVIIALLSTTTINILGLPLMIIKSLFPHNKRNDL